MTIGELLKEERMEKGLTQKQFADGIVSTSYYSKVEKDEHRITAEDLIAVLEHNNIPLWSFFKELSLKGNFQHEYKINLEAEVMDAYYHSDSKRLEEIIQDLNNSNEPDKKDDLLIVEGWLESLKEDDEEPNIEVREALKDRVFNIPNLNKEKLTLFCNFMDFYDLDSNIAIAKNAINKFIGSNETEIQEVLLAMIANLLCLSIKENNYSYVDYLVTTSEKLPLKPQFFLYKDMIYFYKHLSSYHFNHKNEDLDNCHIIIANVKLVGMNEYGTELEKFLNKHI
ncbi:transcriptional activator, Rgg/GadR/MutR family domain-containing protein [Lactobacillus amylolyticus]|uniref:helix-turn-helix domain-containing protein n=1 Tax=Lactobacillus TaxID=1578 RepID=UPI0009BB3652|nr:MULTISPECIES: Rgg/GadR/MutR family transcriptional regulator [Lactobacillus]ARD07007.1 transcriptional activator, Rgg/GadR/MutR family domain-containing protein [Lactobacillus amylolyticus]